MLNDEHGQNGGELSSMWTISLRASGLHGYCRMSQMYEQGGFVRRSDRYIKYGKPSWCSFVKQHPSDFGEPFLNVRIPVCCVFGSHGGVILVHFSNIRFGIFHWNWYRFYFPLHGTRHYCLLLWAVANVCMGIHATTRVSKGPPCERLIWNHRFPWNFIVNQPYAKAWMKGQNR